MKWLRRVTLIGFYGLVACSTSPPDRAGSDAQAAEVPAAQDESPEPMVSRALGGSGSLIPDRSPNSFRGDFDGDGKPDLLAVVVVRGKASDLPATVQLVRPWPPNAGVTPVEDLTQGSRVGLVVIHAAPGDGRNFLLHDPNPVSILDTDAARALFVAAHSELVALEEPDLAGRARGDVIVLPTEAGIDTYLYWDGSTYQLFEPAEVP